MKIHYLSILIFSLLILVLSPVIGVENLFTQEDTVLCFESKNKAVNTGFRVLIFSSGEITLDLISQITFNAMIVNITDSETNQLAFTRFIANWSVQQINTEDNVIAQSIEEKIEVNLSQANISEETGILWNFQISSQDIKFQVCLSIGYSYIADPILAESQEELISLDGLLGSFVIILIIPAIIIATFVYFKDRK